MPGRFGSFWPIGSYRSLQIWWITSAANFNYIPAKVSLEKLQVGRFFSLWKKRSLLKGDMRLNFRVFRGGRYDIPAFHGSCRRICQQTTPRRRHSAAAGPKGLAAFMKKPLVRWTSLGGSRCGGDCFFGLFLLIPTVCWCFSVLSA